jgi:Protein involved in formate dehydrogenase formation
MERSTETKNTDSHRPMMRSAGSTRIRMPTLADAARRLDGPAPMTVDRDAYAALRAIWHTFPLAAAAWRSVISPDHPTAARWRGLDEGIPLLDETMFDWEAAALRQQYGRLRRLVRSPPFFAQESLGDLLRLLIPRGNDPLPWSRLFFQADVNDLKPEVLLGGYIIQPFLYGFARRVLPGLHQASWRGSGCPVCGGKPYHGYLHPRTRQKILICGKCQCPWIAGRLRCPFCENTMQDSLGYFYRDSPECRRVDFCTACRALLPITPYPESGCPFPLHDHLTSMSLLDAVGRRRDDDQPS